MPGFTIKLHPAVQNSDESCVLPTKLHKNEVYQKEFDCYFRC